MKHMKFLVTLIVATISLNANAALLSLDSAGTDILIPPNNDIFYDGVTSYDVGGNIFADTIVDLTFTYLGHEAGYNNDFYAYSGNLNNKTNSVGDSFSVFNVAAGLLDFRFYANNISSGIANGSNMGWASYQSFATLLDYTFMGTFYDAIILFDDSGAGPDDNHDDHIIGINARAVPEPGTFVLMSITLIGLGLVRRRKSL